ncbi:MAG TPA: hypothetical protein DER01_00480 [Phycisphaerales bacterium]|nr:hypothetical protein [Phycisphaerales bacterium]|tara:strand:- start:253 stop:1290 length:1038 start_codon:yes stop_codon:yes gene_type:complete
MRHLLSKIRLFVLFVTFLPFCEPIQAQTDSSKPGQTTIATWQDNHTAAFMLLFDDSWPSHFQVAIPALIERQMFGTFYLNPGKGEFTNYKNKWATEIWKTGMVYGNHTMTHKGVKDFEDAKREIGDCTQTILDMVPGKNPRLISWAMPGVGKGKWNITKDQLNALLKEFNLINRPTFRDHGAVYHLKKIEHYTKLVDIAIQKSELGYVIIHGLERRAPMNTKWQDFWPMNQDLYYQLLDYMASKRDAGQLWITDHISAHQYQTQLQTAKVQLLSNDSQQIKLKLTCDADPQFYDHPMTLNTIVPASWKTATVKQGDRETKIDIQNSKAIYHALPDSSTITLHEID